MNRRRCPGAFRSISASGAVNGVVLNNTGTNGGLTVTGTGAVNSDGTIQNTTGDSIVATNTHDISLTRILTLISRGDGINATDLRGTTTSTGSTLAQSLPSPSISRAPQRRPLPP
ncbi:MAG: hypothetical protein SGI77_09675 [Pirellulaceae bacterium]|nr:hypothetical protein [Pirellulaceae bacterium]